MRCDILQYITQDEPPLECILEKGHKGGHKWKLGNEEIQFQSCCPKGWVKEYEEKRPKD